VAQDESKADSGCDQVWRIAGVLESFHRDDQAVEGSRLEVGCSSTLRRNSPPSPLHGSASDDLLALSKLVGVDVAPPGKPRG
jgi:hypothetical protein